MLAFYNAEYITYHNDKELGREWAKGCCEENELDNEIIDISWDNLTEMYRRYGLALYFNYMNLKKGRIVCPFDSFKTIKEWKEPLNIRLVAKYETEEPKIIDVLKWHDQKQAIQYLQERSLSIRG